jgi:Zn-dependent peptidase ImmA (M78 family)
MTKSDDSTLRAADLLAVEARGRLSLDKAAAWGRFPTPVDDILSAAELRVAPKGMFDVESFMAYAKKKATGAIHALKSAISKVLGIYDANEQIIHVDESVGPTKQTFLKLHETGHHELPTHRKIFQLFQDCEKTLEPSVADQFEREANNFARFALFQGTAFKEQAADMKMGIKTPMALGKKFGASNYAAAREFVRSHHTACLLYALDPLQVIPGVGARAAVRRLEVSATFEKEFGRPNDTLIDTNHALSPLLPVFKKMTRPTTLHYRDKNGITHECLGEAFKTPYNVFLLIYPVRALTATSIFVPASFAINGS